MARTTFLLLVATLTLHGPSASEVQDSPPATFVVLDVAGDGIALGNLATGVEFDFDSNGQRRRVAWTQKGSDDGFLVIDADQNGVIDSGKEMVGTRVATPGGGRANSGADALQFAFQGVPLGDDGRPVGGVPRPLPNGFGVLDKDDPAFSRLSIWRDSDHDGRTGKGELQALGDAEVISILLGFKLFGRNGPTDDAGNRRLLSGSFRINRQGVNVLREMAEIIPVR